MTNQIRLFTLTYLIGLHPNSGFPLVNHVHVMVPQTVLEIDMYLSRKSGRKYLIFSVSVLYTFHLYVFSGKMDLLDREQIELWNNKAINIVDMGLLQNYFSFLFSLLRQVYMQLFARIIILHQI